MLRLFARRGLLPPEAAAEMRQWEHGGASLSMPRSHQGHGPEGLERLLRYCARPIFASEPLLWAQPAERGDTFALSEPLPEYEFDQWVNW